MNTAELIKQIFNTVKTIAVVGISEKTHRPSNSVAHYLQNQGYRIIPINPNITEIFGEKAYPSLLDIPKDIKIDVVDVFRRSDEVMPIVKNAISIGTSYIWLQDNVYSEEAWDYAKEHAVPMIMNDCMLRRHRQLM